MPEPRIIKKYPNRRIYDTRDSRYITLGDVRDLVVSGEEFKVIDTQTKKDITRNITRRLAKAVSAAVSISDGDLTHRIEFTKANDEIGQLLQAMSAMQTSLTEHLTQ